MIETKYNYSNIFAVVFMALVFLYGAYHIGRWHEKQLVNDRFNDLYRFVVDADFIIPNDLEYGGEIATGRCIYGTGLDQEISLLDYTGFEYR